MHGRGTVLACLHLTATFLSIESFYRKLSFSFCSTALVIITRMPPSLAAKKRCLHSSANRDVNLGPTPPLLAERFELKTSFTGRLFVRRWAAAAGSGKLQLFSINGATIDLNMW